MIFAPSTFRSLPPKLPTGVETNRQGALTVGKWVCSSVLELLEGLVCLKALRNVLCALITDAVETHTASESQKDTSGGADSREMMCGDLQQLLQAGVGLQRLGDVLGALRTDAVVGKTASES